MEVRLRLFPESPEILLINQLILYDRLRKDLSSHFLRRKPIPNSKPHRTRLNNNNQ